MLSDVHLTDSNPEGRLDNIVDEQFAKLEFIFKYAKKHKCKVLQAGDLLNAPKQWNLLSRIMSLIKKYDVEIFSVKGQHDQYFRSKKDTNTLFDILSLVPMIHNISNKQIDLGSGVCVTGVAWEHDIPQGNLDADTNILVIHAPIGTTALFPDHKYNDAMRFLREHKTYNIILCGDIHRHFMLRDRKRAIVNCGPMLRLTAETYNFKHEPCFYVYDTIKRSMEKVIIPHKPANDVLTRDHLEKVEQAELLLDNFVNGLKKTRVFNAGVDIVANINKYCKEKKVPKRIKRRINKLREEHDD